MKKLCFFCFIYCLGFAGAVYSQAASYDSTFRTDRFQVEVDQFRHFPQSKKDIVFVGNSITYYINWTELLNDTRVKNRGISGDHTFGVLERLHDIIAGKPAKIFILIGINDLSRNYPLNVIANNYERIIKQIKQGSPSTKVYFQSVLPVNTTFIKAKKYYDKADSIIELNARLKELCSKEAVTYVDLHSNFLDSDGQLLKLYTYDGVHLTIEGYLKWKEIIKEYLKGK